MEALSERRVRISVMLSTHLQPGDELDLTPYGLWRVIELEGDPSPAVTTVLAVMDDGHVALADAGGGLNILDRNLNVMHHYGGNN
ncbi:hypothetical protein HNQ07_004667 [Deinococcus metalli]|nr:hypothetical protein [Deinococcus metalli]MBB5379152.1 hypothetical protein [Deinococcus metalli]